MVVTKVEDIMVADQRICTFIDDNDCRFTFGYGYKTETGELQVGEKLIINYYFISI